MNFIKLLAIPVISIALVGCGHVRLKTETVEVYKPILYCPAPNWDELARPVLAIDTMTPRQRKDLGEVAKHYKATVKQLIDYSYRLERELEQYDKTNEAYAKLKDEFMKAKVKDGFTEKE